MILVNIPEQALFGLFIPFLCNYILIRFTIYPLTDSLQNIIFIVYYIETKIGNLKIWGFSFLNIRIVNQVTPY